jgi:hypothetical protein
VARALLFRLLFRLLGASLFVFLFVFWGGWLLGCGDAARPPRDARAFFLDWYRIECDATRRCCQVDLDVQRCAEQDVAAFAGLLLEQLGEEMARGQIVFDAAVAARCLAVRQAAWATCAGANEGPYAGCEAVFAGTVPVAAACELDICDDCLPPPLAVSECQAGSYCDVPGDPTLRPSGHYVGVCTPFVTDGACTEGAACASGQCDGRCLPATVRPHVWAC